MPTVDVLLSPDDLRTALEQDVRSGLTAQPKTLPPKWFYDDRGSDLFGEITTLPEYYPTRIERALLDRHAAEIASITGARVMVELGSGSATKTRILLDALRSTLETYVPQDVSAGTLISSAADLAADYPGLTVHGVVSDFTGTLHHLPAGERRMVAFLGGTIGNLVPAERADFLREVREVLDPGDHLLLGAGLVVDPAVVVPAYDDAAGVTAEFNRNVLHVVNRELGANFDPDAFAHVAIWDAEDEWIEMRLKATRAMRVNIADLDLAVEFTDGE